MVITSQSAFASRFSEDFTSPVGTELEVARFYYANQDYQRSGFLAWRQLLETKPLIATKPAAFDFFGLALKSSLKMDQAYAWPRLRKSVCEKNTSDEAGRQKAVTPASVALCHLSHAEDWWGLGWTWYHEVSQGRRAQALKWWKHLEKEAGPEERKLLEKERVLFAQLRGFEKTATALAGKRTGLLVPPVAGPRTWSVIGWGVFPGGGHFFRRDIKKGLISLTTVGALGGAAAFFLNRERWVVGLASAWFAMVFYQQSILVALRGEFHDFEHRRHDRQTRILAKSSFAF